MSDDIPVKEEQTNWRDLALSKRHRDWGYDCPAVDIDFILIEYDSGEAKALIEYKRSTAPPIENTHPSIRALEGLCDKAGIPFFIVVYDIHFFWFDVVPLNEHAKCYSYGGEKRRLSEEEYVAFLYDLRGRTHPKQLRL